MVKRSGLPVLGELVLCTVQRITPYAAWCKLDEYEGKECMIHISQIAGKWIHDIKDFVKPNKQYVAKVIKIDEETNQINLSLKRVSKRDQKEKMNSFRKEQRAEKILEQAAHKLGKDLETAYTEVGFLLQENFGDLWDAFEEAKEDNEILAKSGVPKDWSDALLEIVQRIFKEKEITLKAEVELKSYADDGVEKIKNVLTQLEKSGFNVKYMSAPKYRVEVKTKDPKVAEKKLREQLDFVLKQAKSTEVIGSFKLIE